LNEFASVAGVRLASLTVGYCVLGLTAVAPLQVACAQTPSVSQTLDDARMYVTAPLRWDKDDWKVFGGTLAVIAASHELDGKTRDHFAGANGVVLDGKDRHSTRDALPAAAVVAGTWLYAASIHDSTGFVEGWNMLEAAGLSTATAYALKFAAGRQRPNESTSADRWFSGGNSFPSLHATAAFAIGTVLAESGNDRWRWVRRGLGYGIAVGTAYRRLDGNAHWLSDTVAGAAIGLSTANFVLQHSQDRRLARGMSVVPLEGGVMLSWTMPLN